MAVSKHSPGACETAIVVGLGELGGVFSLAMLRRGFTVVPMLRDTLSDRIVEQFPNPALCLVAVGEEALPAVLDSSVQRYADRLVLVQNELRPSEWEKRGLPTPTVAVIWFEKKPGRDVRALVSTPVFGPLAVTVVNLMSALGLPAHVEPDAERLVFELALKNLYILAMNFAGMVNDTDVGTLWHEHRAVVESISAEILELESAQMQRPLPATSLMLELERIITSDPRHGARGRTAQPRLVRTLATARRLGLQTPILNEIARRGEER